MSTKLNEFIAQVKNYGMARNNRFSVIMNPPATIERFSGLRQILLYCDQVQLPGLNLATVQNRSYGEFREVPYEKLYGDIQMSFYVDTNLYVKTFFDDWMASIQNPYTRTFEYYNRYITDMEIRVEDLQNSSVYVVTAYECYPKTVSPIQMDYANKDIMKLQVTMQYKYWRSESNNVALTDQTVQRNELVPETYYNNFNQFQRDWDNAQKAIRTAGLKEFNIDESNGDFI